VEGPVSHPRVNVIPWQEDELVVIAHPRHRLLRETVVTPEAIAAEQFLVREPGSGTREVTERAMTRAGVRLSKTMRVGGTEAMKQGVAAGLGLAIVSRAAAADQLALGRVAVLDVQDLVIRRALTRLELRDRVTTPAARELESLLSDSPDDAGVADASGVA
jgi:DNA-binding transcriptional LysR family regulator